MPVDIQHRHASEASHFASDENLRRVDAAVKEIFEMMFSLNIEPDIDSAVPFPVRELDKRTAIVGFSGSMRGSCQVCVSRAGAASVASAMLGGLPVDDDDDSLKDALGELCNMLAGGWKNSIPDLSSGCTLSPPTIIAGHNYKILMSKPASRLFRSYKFSEHRLDLTLYREETI